MPTVRRLMFLLLLVVTAAACSSDGARPGGSASSSSSPPLTGTAVPAEPSAGCSAAASSTPPTTDDKLTLTSGGVDRTYFLHVPPTYDGAKPSPLVLDFHGYSEGAELHKSTSMLGPFGDTHGFITATPQGTGPVAFWNTALDGPDVRFVSDLLDSLEQQLCVDERRVYATGYSNGAMLSSAIACRLADRIAAIAPVAGLIDIEGCAPKRPVPIVAFHGTADPIVSFNGGVSEGLKNLPAPDGSGRKLADVGALPGFHPIPDVLATWARLDGCTDAPPKETTVAADVTLVSFDCERVEVELYRVEGGGHSWPGSQFTAAIASIVGPTTMSIHADDVMWAFFEQHPLPV